MTLGVAFPTRCTVALKKWLRHAAGGFACSLPSSMPWVPRGWFGSARGDTAYRTREAAHRRQFERDCREAIMKMTSDKRAIDKIYKRRDRYEIPDWQRQKVWGRARQQALIDSILRGWKLPKFYFLRRLLKRNSMR